MLEPNGEYVISYFIIYYYVPLMCLVFVLFQCKILYEELYNNCEVLQSFGKLFDIAVHFRSYN